MKVVIWPKLSNDKMLKATMALMKALDKAETLNRLDSLKIGSRFTLVSVDYRSFDQSMHPQWCSGKIFGPVPR